MGAKSFIVQQLKISLRQQFSIFAQKKKFGRQESSFDHFLLNFFFAKMDLFK